jgi:hypothetical protein
MLKQQGEFEICKVQILFESNRVSFASFQINQKKKIEKKLEKEEEGRRITSTQIQKTAMAHLPPSPNWYRILLSSALTCGPHLDAIPHVTPSSSSLGREQPNRENLLDVNPSDSLAILFQDSAYLNPHPS